MEEVKFEIHVFSEEAAQQLLQLIEDAEMEGLFLDGISVRRIDE